MRSEAEILEKIHKARSLLHTEKVSLDDNDVTLEAYNDFVVSLEERISILRWVLEADVRDEDVDYL